MFLSRFASILFFAMLAAGFLGQADVAAAKEKAADNYKLFCVQCHGTKGTGRGINAPALSVQPRNHTSAKDMGSLTDESVAKAIKEGGIAVAKSTQMPPFGGVLTDEEIADLVKHLRGMCKCEGKK
ncbi:MAG: cytochrome c [Nitrospinota bacterium]|nr:cytochrome c [Nitrospinota bacterium]